MVRLNWNDTALQLTIIQVMTQWHRGHDSLTQGTWLIQNPNQAGIIHTRDMTHFIFRPNREALMGWPPTKEKSQHATKYSVYTDCRTDFWEFLPDARATHWLATIRRHLAAVIMLCKIRFCVLHTTQTLWFIITMIFFSLLRHLAGALFYKGILWKSSFVLLYNKTKVLCIIITRGHLATAILLCALYTSQIVCIIHVNRILKKLSGLFWKRAHFCSTHLKMPQFRRLFKLPIEFLGRASF